METIDERNGCLFAVPGSHRDVLYPHAYPDVIIVKTMIAIIFSFIIDFTECKK